MLTNTLKKLFERDLNKLKSELELYQNEANLWSVQKNISNSAGNLCLHLLGNLNHFIGATLGKTNYIRNRELEFSSKNIPRTALLAQIDEVLLIINTSLDKLQEQDLQDDFPILVFVEKTSVEFFLVHLSTHLAYHLGQINYHRRLIDQA